METEDLKIFVETTIDYFEKVTGHGAQAGVPRIVEDDGGFLREITGAIGIAGEIQGAIYVTGDEVFFRDLLLAFNPNADTGRENVLDAAGELANTIAGNGQKAFGSGLRISVPMIFTGTNPQIRMREPRFLIPIEWRGHRFSLVVGVTSANAR